MRYPFQETMTRYELEINPEGEWNEALWEKLKVVAMLKSCSPYAVIDEFGRIYTAFYSYRLAMDAAVQARLMAECRIHVYPFTCPVADILPQYSFTVCNTHVPQHERKFICTNSPSSDRESSAYVAQPALDARFAMPTCEKRLQETLS